MSALGLQTSRVEPGLAQIRFMKIRIELVKRFELKNLAQTRLVII
jgi:hypothetical protein